MLTELTTGGTEQMSLFSMGDPTADQGAIPAISAWRCSTSINARMGQGTLFHAAEGVGTAAIRRRSPSSEKWRGGCSRFKSPSYTTRWSDLARVG